MGLVVGACGAGWSCGVVGRCAGWGLGRWERGNGSGHGVVGRCAEWGSPSPGPSLPGRVVMRLGVGEVGGDVEVAGGFGIAAGEVWEVVGCYQFGFDAAGGAHAA